MLSTMRLFIKKRQALIHPVVEQYVCAGHDAAVHLPAKVVVDATGADDVDVVVLVVVVVVVVVVEVVVETGQVCPQFPFTWSLSPRQNEHGKQPITGQSSARMLSSSRPPLVLQYWPTGHESAVHDGGAVDEVGEMVVEAEHLLGHEPSMALLKRKQLRQSAQVADP